MAHEEPRPGIPFLKMHGLANDYVLFDGFTTRRPSDLEPLARRVLDRRRGVGGDGLLWVSPHDGADARMEIRNADGSRAEMCGNGIRCVGRFLWERKGLGSRVDGEIASTLVVETDAGTRRLEILPGPGDRIRVRVDMLAPIWRAPTLPCGPGGEPFVERRLALDPVLAEAAGLSSEAPVLATAVSVGNPHCVLFVPDVDRVRIESIGPAIQSLDSFPEGTNVEFVDRNGATRAFRQRTWERGVGETWACGTGACAVLAAAVRTGRVVRDAAIELRGGTLELAMTPEGHVLMTGDAALSFEGRWFDVEG